MLKADYCYNDLKHVFLEAGLQQGDTVLMHSDLAKLGISKEFIDGKDPAESVFHAIFDIIGAEGTLIVPTFTYSFCKGEIYDPEGSKSTVGYFGNWFRKQPGIKRSKDPIFSFAALGPNTDFLFDIGNASFDEHSTFAKLAQIENAKVLFLGSYVDFTALHYVQYCMKVPIRYNKLFSGKVLENGTLKVLDWIYYVRANIANTSISKAYYYTLLTEGGLDALFAADKCHDDIASPLDIYKLGQAHCFAGSYKGMLDNCRMWIAKDPWHFSAGPACDIITEDKKRTGEAHYNISINLSDKETSIDNILQIPRYTLSDGYDALLKAMAQQVDLTVHFYNTGYMVNGKPVPERWHCNKAQASKLDGTVILDADKVIPYSPACNSRLSKDQLQEYFNIDGVELLDGFYNVEIDSYFSYSRMQVGSCLIKGKSEHCIIAVADITTNDRDELMNILDAIEFFKNMPPKEHEISFCLLLTPGQIGLDCYLEQSDLQIERIVNLNYENSLSIWK